LGEGQRVHDPERGLRDFVIGQEFTLDGHRARMLGRPFH